MSWIVERLLIDRASIRSKIFGNINEYDNTAEYAFVDVYATINDNDTYVYFLDSDVYNKLLFLEKKVEELYKSGHLSDREMEVITYMSEGYSITDVAKTLDTSRITIKNIFRNACNRISHHLGGSYTDQGFLEELQKNYKLTDIQIEKIRDRINSKYRHVMKNNRSDL